MAGNYVAVFAGGPRGGERMAAVFDVNGSPLLDIRLPVVDEPGAEDVYLWHGVGRYREWSLAAGDDLPKRDRVFTEATYEWWKQAKPPIQ